MQSLGSCAVKVPIAVELLGRQPEVDEGGVSVVHVLSTSHVAIHTWPEHRFFNLDVFSCRAFELDPVFAWLHATLGTRSYGASSWRR
jgi:S-adenosylmethionine/arginine decarboxylase-like enzyme